jgi:hypothetical protein
MNNPCVCVCVQQTTSGTMFFVITNITSPLSTRCVFLAPYSGWNGKSSLHLHLIQEVHKCDKILGATSKFLAPEGWQEASSIMRTHNSGVPCEPYWFFWSMLPHVPYGLRGLPARLWPKCNRLLRVGGPSGAATLSRWGGWWYMNMKYREGS